MKQFGETPPKMDVHNSKTKKFRETSSEKCSVPAIVFETATKPTHLAHLCEGAQIHGDPWRLPRKTTSECQKVVRDLHATAACIFARLNFQKLLRCRGAFNIFTSTMWFTPRQRPSFDFSSNQMAPRQQL